MLSATAVLTAVLAAAPGWIGVETNVPPILSGEKDPGCARVELVDPAGPAARAGLIPGMCITQLGTEVIRGTLDLLAAVHEAHPGSTMTVMLADGTKRPIVIAERSDKVERDFCTYVRRSKTVVIATVVVPLTVKAFVSREPPTVEAIRAQLATTAKAFVRLPGKNCRIAPGSPLSVANEDTLLPYGSEIVFGESPPSDGGVSPPRGKKF